MPHTYVPTLHMCHRAATHTSHVTYICAIWLKGLTGCMLVLEIVFVGQCEVFGCIDFVHFFPHGRKGHRSTNRSVNSLKKKKKKCGFF